MKFLLIVFFFGVGVSNEKIVGFGQIPPNSNAGFGYVVFPWAGCPVKISLEIQLTKRCWDCFPSSKPLMIWMM